MRIHAGGLAFKIEFPNQRPGRREYRENLQAFFEQRQAALPSVDALTFDSFLSTATPSEPRTPRQPAIYLDEKVIGKGEFGEVRRVIKARDGLFYAAKAFYPPFKDSDRGQKRKRGEDGWRYKIRDEIDVMRNNPHVSVPLPAHGPAPTVTLIIGQPNVMQVLDFQLTPEPTLVMPYYHDGHLARHLRNLSEKQYVSALRQILLGLRHLHGRGVIHRDLKPENLLVDMDMKNDEITVVIADFGFSKDATSTNDLVKTFCGSLLYAAPDIFPGRSDGYGVKVDIWSAGVIVFDMYGLPEAPAVPWRKDPRRQAVAVEKWISTWTQSLLAKLDEANENDDKVVNILLHMIDPDPERRYSAHECLEMGCRNGLFNKTRDGRIVDADTDADDRADATAQTDSRRAGGEVEASRPQSPQLSETSTNNTSFIIGNLWDNLGARSRRELGASANSPAGIEDSISGRLTRRLTTSVSTAS